MFECFWFQARFRSEVKIYENLLLVFGLSEEFFLRDFDFLSGLPEVVRVLNSSALVEPEGNP